MMKTMLALRFLPCAVALLMVLLSQDVNAHFTSSSSTRIPVFRTTSVLDKDSPFGKGTANETIEASVENLEGMLLRLKEGRSVVLRQRPSFVIRWYHWLFTTTKTANHGETNDNEDAVASIQQLIAAIKSSQSDNAVMRQTLDTMKRELERSDDQLKDAQRDLRLLQRGKVSELQKRILQLKDTIKQLESSLRKKESFVGDLKDQVAFITSKFHESEKRNVDFQHENQDKQGVIARLDQENQQIEKKMKNIQYELGYKQVEISTMRNLNERYESLIKDRDHEIQQLHTQIRSLQVDQNTLSRQIKTLQEENSCLLQEKESFKRVQGTNDPSEDTRRGIEQAKRMLMKNFEKERDQFAAKVSELTQAKWKLQDEVGALTQQRISLQSEKRQLKLQLEEEKEKEKKKSGAGFDAMTKELERTKEELCGWKEKADRLQQAMQSSEKTEEQATAELATVKEAHHMLEAQAKELMSQVGQLTGQLKDKDEELYRCHQLLQETKHACDKMGESLLGAEGKGPDDMQSMADQLAKLKESQAESQKRLKDLLEKPHNNTGRRAFTGQRPAFGL